MKIAMQSTARSYTYTVLLWPDSETGDVAATVPSLPGCVAQGQSREEALQFIRAAIRQHVDGMLEDGVDVPFEDAHAQAEIVTIAA